MATTTDAPADGSRSFSSDRFSSDGASRYQPLLDEANRRFDAADIAGSEELYEVLASVSELADEGCYGLGLVHLERGNTLGAENEFEEALRHNPRHANAWYHLGSLADSRADRDRARDCWKVSLSINPRHSRARRSLELRANEDERIDRWGVYRLVFARDPEFGPPLLEAMHATRLATRPRFRAYVGRYWLRTAALCSIPLLALAILVAPSAADVRRPLYAAGLPRLTYDNPRSFWLGAVAAVVFGVLAVGYAHVRSINIAVERGRLQIERGVFARRRTNVELWRIQDVVLERRAVNRLTGDGALILHPKSDLTELSHRSFLQRLGRKNAAIVLTGVASGAELERTYRAILDFVFLLRANRLTQGIPL